MGKGNDWRAPAALWSLGALWPALYGALTAWTRTPLERALYESWCGSAPHAGAEFLGHCAACWSGTAAFMLAGALALAVSRRRRSRAAA